MAADTPQPEMAGPLGAVIPIDQPHSIREKGSTTDELRHDSPH